MLLLLEIVQKGLLSRVQDSYICQCRSYVSTFRESHCVIQKSRAKTHIQGHNEVDILSCGHEDAYWVLLQIHHKDACTHLQNFNNRALARVISVKVRLCLQRILQVRTK